LSSTELVNVGREEPADVDTRYPVPRQVAALLPARWQQALDRYAGTLGTPVAVARTEDVVVSSFSWIQGKSFNEQFDLFSKRGFSGSSP